MMLKYVLNSVLNDVELYVELFLCDVELFLCDVEFCVE